MTQQEMQIKASDEDLKGRYTNAMQVLHTKEEFIMDFLSLNAPVGILVNRIITSPGHMKRIVLALQDNLKRYEDKYGKVEEAEEPKSIGFRA